MNINPIALPYGDEWYSVLNEDKKQDIFSMKLNKLLKLNLDRFYTESKFEKYGFTVYDNMIETDTHILIHIKLDYLAKKGPFKVINKLTLEVEYTSLDNYDKLPLTNLSNFKQGYFHISFPDKPNNIKSSILFNDIFEIVKEFNEYVNWLRGNPVILTVGTKHYDVENGKFITEDYLVKRGKDCKIIYIPNKGHFLIRNVKEVIECQICFEEIDVRKVLLPCGHSKFCEDCLEKLDTCPICRRKIDKTITLF